MIARDLSKQQVLDVNAKAIQQIDFTEIQDHAENTTISLVLK